jgi:KDO2-lipid IV(A) lauroyltransferase
MAYLGYLVARFVARVLPLGLAAAVAERVGDIWYAACPRLRSDLDRNLALLPALRDSTGLRGRIARKAVRNFARVVTEFLCLPRLGTLGLERLVDLEGFRRLAAVVGDRPAVLVTAHLGNWELGAAAAAAVGLRLHVVVYDHPDPRVASLFRRIREVRGLKVISLSSAARGLGGLIGSVPVGIAGDRDFTGHGIEAVLFGARVRVPSAYAALAVSKDVAIIPGFCVRGTDGRYHLESEPPLTGETGGPLGAAEAVRQYLSIVEKYVEKYPDQWYRFDNIGT